MPASLFIWLAPTAPDATLGARLAALDLEVVHLTAASALSPALTATPARIRGVHIASLPPTGWPPTWTQQLLALPHLYLLSVDLPVAVVAALRHTALAPLLPPAPAGGAGWLPALTRDWPRRRSAQDRLTLTLLNHLRQQLSPDLDRPKPQPWRGPATEPDLEELAPQLEPAHSGAPPDLDDLAERVDPEEMDKAALDEAMAEPALPPDPRLGEILYYIPPAVGMDQPGTAEVRIGYREVRDRLIAGLPAEAQAGAVRVQDELSPVMAVSLAEYPAPKLFDIIPWNHAEQAVLPDEVTAWTFGLAAKAPGQALLMLRITAKVHLPGYGERAHDLVVLNRSVAITATATPEAPILSPLRRLTHWTSTEGEALRRALGQGDTAAALDWLEAYLCHQPSPAPLRDELILIQARWHSLQQEQVAGRLSPQEWEIGRNKVHHSILTLGGELER